MSTTIDAAPLERVLSALTEAGCDPKQRGERLDARCPAHDDKNPSLSLSEGSDGRVLLNCHAGCRVDDIIAALGMTMSDLFVHDGGERDRRPRIVETYQYRDEAGEVLYEVVRFEPKDFRQRRPDGRGGWSWKLGDVLRVPYRLPELIQAVDAGETVYVVEGEKDAEAMVRAGYCATCCPGGAGKWRSEFARYFAGATVTVVADRDEVGYRHAHDVLISLAGVAATVRVVQAAHGKDAADHLVAGLGVDDFEDLTADELESLCEKGDDTERTERGGSAGSIGLHLPAEFYAAREILSVIRDAAHARQRSADALLYSLLARVAASVSHTLKLPPIVGTETALCFFAVLLGPPGVGKSSAQGIGAELLPCEEFSLGSGEGIIESLFDFVKEPDPDDPRKLVSVKRQTRFNALVIVDEGQALAALGSRSNSTLLPTLRSIFTGAALGQMNASQDRRRCVPRGQYAIGIVMGMQAALAGPLLADADAGTPQRFAWCMATDPSIPDEPPEFPLVGLHWQPPAPGLLEQYQVASGPFVRHHMTLAPSIVGEVRSGDLDVARGLVEIDTFEAHHNLVKLKLAALLALLDGRLDVTEEDWALADTMKSTSDAVRRHAQRVVAEDEHAKETATSGRLARRHVEAKAAESGWRIVECANRISAKVAASPGIPVSQVRRDLRAWRPEFVEGLDHATAAGWIVERLEAGQGNEKRVLHPSDGAGR